MIPQTDLSSSAHRGRKWKLLGAEGREPLLFSSFRGVGGGGYTGVWIFTDRIAAAHTIRAQLQGTAPQYLVTAKLSAQEGRGPLGEKPLGLL